MGAHLLHPPSGTRHNCFKELTCFQDEKIKSVVSVKFFLSKVPPLPVDIGTVLWGCVCMPFHTSFLHSCLHFLLYFSADAWLHILFIGLCYLLCCSTCLGFGQREVLCVSYFPGQALPSATSRRDSGSSYCLRKILRSQNFDTKGVHARRRRPRPRSQALWADKIRDSVSIHASSTHHLPLSSPFR